MMFLRRRAMFIFLGILTVILKSISVLVASPIISANSDPSYQENEEFKREIREKLEDLHKNNGKLFDRILLVNDIHRRWKSKEQLAKRNLNSNNVINVNSANDNLKFEGDIVLGPEEKLEIEKTESYRRKRNAVHQRKRIWTTREIPYYLDPILSLEAIDVIHKAMSIIHLNTCVKWVVRTSLAQKHYVHFKNTDGCSSAIGRAYASPGGQTLSIGKGCEYVPTALHEMTHAMGFYHEQSRNDRHKYIKILWENIPDEFKDQFKEYSHGTIDKMNKDYDMKSLMHYSSTAFGNGKTTIAPIDPSKSIGDAWTYTPLDIVEINALYDCQSSSANQKLSSWSLWTECDDKCYKERQRFCFSRNKADCPNTNFYGIDSERVKCSSLECPARIDGNWATWSSWGTCSKICDEGQRQRTRSCNNPAPANGGRSCVGKSTDVSTCVKRRCNLGKYDAEFEGSWGIWSSVNSANLIPWTQLSYGTKTMDTGPQGDHTLQGKGKFVYVESSGRAKGNMGRLQSRTLDFSTPQCLSFYYNMYGSLTGSLTLWMVPEGKAWLNLFTKSGNQGQDWHNADVTLDYKGKFKLVFEVILGGRGYSDTALDDIFVDNHACPGYVECKDNSNSCSFWANSGECDKNPGYMNTNCKESCGLCPGTPPKKCEDANSNCVTWAAVGECQKSPGYMLVKCKASCSICRGMCEDGNSECEGWAKIGECTANPAWMNVNCKKSCGKC